MLKFVSLILFCCLLTATGSAASFDCKKAGTGTEKTICANPQMSDLDDLLLASYKKALANAPDPVSVKAAQRNWLNHSRASCSTVACLKKAYETRLIELNATVSTGKQSPISLGHYRRYYRNRLDSDPADLIISQLKSGRYHLIGNALWGMARPIAGPNDGEIEGDFDISGNQAKLETGDCSLSMMFSPGAIAVKDYQGDCGGLNVTFDGEYRKAHR